MLLTENSNRLQSAIQGLPIIFGQGGDDKIGKTLAAIARLSNSTGPSRSLKAKIRQLNSLLKRI